MNSLNNKIAIVTGGASGIGRSLCLKLSRREATVIIADVNALGAKNVVDEIRANDGQGQAFEVDVSSEDDVRFLVDEVIKRYGRIDYMFNNAGIELNGELLNVDTRCWLKGMEVNLNGVIYGATAVYQIMLDQGFGHIVNTASLAGLIPLPGLSYYVATKHAVVGFSLSLRAEAKVAGIKVSVVCPTLVSTNIRENTAKILGRDVPAYADFQLDKRIKAEVCAVQILRGVLRNKAIILVPRLAGLLWCLYRFSPLVYNTAVASIYARLSQELDQGRSA